MQNTVELEAKNCSLSKSLGHKKLVIQSPTIQVACFSNVHIFFGISDNNHKQILAKTKRIFPLQSKALAAPFG